MAYQDGDVLIRAVMEASTGLPEDRIVNTFSFTSAVEQDAAGLSRLCTLVSDFYRLDNGFAGQAAGTYLSNFINRGATHKLEAYRIQAGDLGSPIYETAWLGPPVAREALGNEPSIACVLSFHGDLVEFQEEAGITRPKSRHRGRIYFGPLTLNSIATDTPPYRLVDGGVPGSLRRAAVALMDASEAGVDGRWAVWSRVNQSLDIVTGGWTDNAPDNQRRRGPKASARVVYGS